MDISTGEGQAQLEAVVTYYRLVKHLKAAAIGSIIFGVLAIAGVSSADAQFDDVAKVLNVLLLLLGVFLVAEGIWLLLRPTPQCLVVDGITMLIVGIWNLGTTVLAMSSQLYEANTFFAILGVCQLLWGAKSIIAYRSASSASQVATQPNLVRTLAETMAASVHVPLDGDWTVRRVSRLRPMVMSDVDIPLSDLVEKLLRRQIDPKRVLVSPPGGESFSSITETEELCPILARAMPEYSESTRGGERR